MHGHFAEQAFCLTTELKNAPSLCLRTRLHNNASSQTEVLIVTAGDMLTAEFLHQSSFVPVSSMLTGLRCQIQKSTSGWSLTQCSRTLSCAVNDAAVAYGKTVELRQGDRIELGLLLLIVENNENSDSARKLASAIAPKAQQEHPEPDGDVNPFACLPRFQPDMRSDTPSFYTGPDVTPDVIHALADDYLMAIVNPASRQTHYMATAATALPPVQKQEQNIPAHFSLEDVLSGQLTIEQVLAEIGTEDAQWNRSGANEDVLMLFADGIARRVQPHLPDLTRREHHTVSPDSHLSLDFGDDPAVSLIAKSKLATRNN